MASDRNKSDCHGSSAISARRGKLNLNFRLYVARHTFASRAIEEGIDLLILANILGHSNLKMVMRYTLPSETFKADAIRKMEQNRKAKAV